MIVKLIYVWFAIHQMNTSSYGLDSLKCNLIFLRALAFALFFVGLPAFSADTRTAFLSALRQGQAQTIIAYGTSLTASGTWVEYLRGELNRNFPGQATVINSGKDGMSSHWGVANLDAQVLDKAPNAVFIEFSINDAYSNYRIPPSQARKNLEDMIDRITAARPDCEIILMVMNPVLGEPKRLRPLLAQYEQIYRDVSRKRHLRLMDFTALWRTALIKTPNSWSNLIPDGLHPSRRGEETVVYPELARRIGISIPTK